MKKLRTTLALLVPVLLAACGGGGDGTPANTTEFEIAAAFTTLATGEPEVFTLSGSIAGQPATMHIEHTAMPDAAFATFGTMNAMRRSATMSAAGTTETWYEDHHFDLASRMFYGMVDDEGMQAVSDSRAPYPERARIGDGGLMFEAMNQNSMMTAYGRSHVTWSLDPGTQPDDAYLCIHSEQQTMAGAATGDVVHDCYRIDAGGHPLGMRVTVTSPAFGTVVFQ